jgi:hypothetical protein
MNEYPILFSTSMVQAIVQGRKTQTRRIIKRYISPFGNEGDLLWVKESHRIFYGDKTKTFVVEYSDRSVKAFYYKSLSLNLINRLKNRKSLKKGTWVSARFLPKELARIWLQNDRHIVTERLNDISKEDAIAEGIEPIGKLGYRNYMATPNMLQVVNPINSFQSLWQSIHGPDSWKENPWVFAVSFKVVSTTGKPFKV